MLLDNNIINKVLIIFYSMLITFGINLVQTLFTLFDAYIEYFESIKI